MKLDKLPTASAPLEHGMPTGWKRELSEWLLAATAIGIAMGVLVILVKFFLNLAIWLRRMIG